MMSIFYWFYLCVIEFWDANCCVFYVCVKGTKHSFSTIIFFPDTILDIHFWLHISSCEVFMQNGMLLWLSHVQQKHLQIYGLCIGNYSRFNEDHALYFILCHASKRKSPWACWAQEVIGFREQCEETASAKSWQIAFLGLPFQMS